MNSRPWLLVIVLAGCEASSAQEPLKLPPPRPLPQFVGAGSCAASACHNGTFVHRTSRDEYSTWVTRDSHGRAYEILFDRRSKEIQLNLGKKTEARSDPRCLSCHVAPEYEEQSPPPDAPYFKTDGVSCESCHGPAKQWINLHHLDGWRTKSAGEKKQLGMTDTRSLAGRAQVCVRCHVGESGMDVDHELIAAGHPRLHFEFTAFHAHMPRHWPDDKDRAGKPDFDARLWAVGQLATASAGLELLAHRTEKAWPEFAEYDCLSCHHDLRAPSWRQQLGYGKRTPGAFPWGSYVALTRQALESRPDVGLFGTLDKLQAAFDRGKPERRQIAHDARSAAFLLRRRLDQFDQVNRPDDWGPRLFQSILTIDAPNATRGWDEVTRIQLALVALQPKEKGSPTLLDLRNPIVNYHLHLDFPRSTEYARSFEPAAIRKRLLELRAKEPRTK